MLTQELVNVMITGMETDAIWKMNVMEIRIVEIRVNVSRRSPPQSQGIFHYRIHIASLAVFNLYNFKISKEMLLQPWLLWEVL